MSADTLPAAHMQRAFACLPQELYLNVLDQLVGTRSGLRPLAYAPSSPVTQALRALTLVSKSAYLGATKYLYAHCLYLDNCTNYSRFRRTIGLDLGNHPQALNYGEAGRNDKLFNRADAKITCMYASPQRTEKCVDPTPMARLPQIIDLFRQIGPTLKRLAIDLSPLYAPVSEVKSAQPHLSTKNIFLQMPALEDLVCSYETTDYFPHPPPNLKRLATTANIMDDSLLSFCFTISTLEMLVFLRPDDMQASTIDKIFDAYKGRHLDVVLVDTSSGHGTPDGIREWREEDSVTFWEVDVPTSYYGDEPDVILCDGWIWTHGVRGTLWSQQKRRMRCLSELAQALVADADG